MLVSGRYLTALAFLLAMAGLLLNPGLTPFMSATGLHASEETAFQLCLAAGLTAALLALVRLRQRAAIAVLVAGSVGLASVVALFPHASPSQQDFLAGAAVVGGGLAVGWALVTEVVYLVRTLRRPTGPSRELAHVALTLAWLDVGLAPFAFVGEPVPYQFVLVFLAFGVSLYTLAVVRMWIRNRVYRILGVG